MNWMENEILNMLHENQYRNIKVWDVIINTCLNYNDALVEVSVWMSD